MREVRQALSRWSRPERGVDEAGCPPDDIVASIACAVLPRRDALGDSLDSGEFASVVQQVIGGLLKGSGDLSHAFSGEVRAGRGICGLDSSRIGHAIDQRSPDERRTRVPVRETISVCPDRPPNRAQLGRQRIEGSRGLTCSTPRLAQLPPQHGNEGDEKELHASHARRAV